MRIISFLLAFCGIAVCLTGCRSNLYYQARAVERARGFLLENAKELSPEQAYFVKFNNPILLHAPIIGELGFAKEAEHLTSELRQICVYWEIPGASESYLVFGVSDGRMQFWEPIRLVRKNFLNGKLPLDAAITLARSYAQNNLYHAMNAADFNQVRFFMPLVASSEFALNFNPGGNVPVKEQEAARQLAERGTQISLIWKLTTPDSYAVFCGVGQPNLSGWNLQFGGLFNEESVKKYTKQILLTPEQAMKTPVIVPAEAKKEERK